MPEHRSPQDVVVSVVEHNTGGPQPETADADHIKVVACGVHGHPPEAVERAIEQAVSEGQLVEEDGRYRVAE